MLRLFITSLFFICSFGLAQNSNLTVTVSGLKNNTGLLTVELYNVKGKFLKTPYKTFSSAIKLNTATLIFIGIPKGECTVMAYHDENNNRKLDKNFIGMPKEDVGCSITADSRISIKINALD